MTLDDLSKSIFVINLETRFDRKKHIENQLKKINCINYKLVNGIDGNLLKNSTKLKNGMYGLLKTYLKIYEEWIKLDFENILIIEDDAFFIDDFNIKLEEFIKSIPFDWDMIYFGANHNYHIGSKTTKINSKCIKLNNSYSAHCVLLKKNVFIELINEIKKFKIENDVILSNLQKKYNAYSSIEPLVTQIISFSNIENKIVDYNSIIK